MKRLCFVAGLVLLAGSVLASSGTGFQPVGKRQARWLSHQLRHQKGFREESRLERERFRERTREKAIDRKRYRSRKEFLRSIYADRRVTVSHKSDPYEPNDSPANAYPIAYGDTLTEGLIDPAGDLDYFKFTGSAGDTVTIDIDADALGSWLDSYIYLYDTDGVTELESDDDGGSGLDSWIVNYVLPSSGTFYIKVCDFSSDGGSNYFYHISLTNIPVLFGAISGYVTSAEGPLEWVWVDIYDATTYDYISWGYTDATGYYIADGLETGSYKLRTDNWQGYIDEWYNDKPDFDNADIVYVNAPDTTENINFQLEMSGCISGYVTSAEGPLEWVWVDIYDATTYDYISYGYTDETGYYIAGGLPTGDYKVRTWNDYGYADEYWNNKLDWNSADIVNLTAPDTMDNINFELEMGGKIKGYVYGAKGPLEDVEVDAFNPNSGEWINGGYTGSDGSYTIIGLPTGWCKLWAFPDWDDTTHAFEWYDNEDTWLDADQVYVTVPDSVMNKNFTLDDCGFITGTVYEAKGPIQYADVIGWYYTNEFYGWLPWFYDETSADGSYKLTNLRTGNYRVSAEKSGYETRWYNNQPDSSSADLVYVTMPNTTPNIDFYLPVTGIEERENPKSEIRNPKLVVFPNPFTTVVSVVVRGFSLAESDPKRVALRIYDLSGRLIKSFTLATNHSSLTSAVIWDGKDNSGKQVSNGIYFCRLKTENHTLTTKLTLIK